MKKFLTVLLIIAVICTFSISSAFAAVNDANVVSDRTAAMQKITDAYDDAVAELKLALSNAQAGKAPAKNPANASASDWNTACQEAYDEVLVLLNGQLAAAYQAFGNAEQAATEAGGIHGYEFKSPAPATADGYAYIAPAIAMIDLTQITHAKWDSAAKAFTDIKAGEAMYESLLAQTKELVAKYNLEQFVKDDKITKNGETKSSYEWAVEAQSEALAKLNAFGDWGDTVTFGSDTITCNVTAVKGVYVVNNPGTVGESYGGSFYAALQGLKTATVVTTDSAKVEYAKAAFVPNVKAVIEAARKGELEPHNNVIFAQSVASKPNQKAIDDAKEAIEEINKKYDALLEVMTYRMENAEYIIEPSTGGVEYVSAMYDDKYYTGLGLGAYSVAEFNNKVLQNNRLCDPNLAISLLDVDTTEALAITKLVGELKDQAEMYKATVAVDGATLVDVDEALAAAIKEAYMTGAATFTPPQSDTLVHINAHKLLGEKCDQYGVTAKNDVTLSGKTYPTIAKWADGTDVYSKNNSKAVKAIKKEAKAAVKAAATVEDANKAFLDAYEKYDAVLTKADQAKLFAYNGALYKKDTAAEAELKAYIDYKVALMGNTAPAADTAAKIKAYFGIGTTATGTDFLAEVVDEASLQAAVADVKAKVDALKTKDELKAEGKELTNSASAITRPVTLASKEALLGVYDQIKEYEDYCKMVGYTAPTTASRMLVETDIASVEDLELAALKAMKKELGDVAKLTLDKEAAVNEFVAAQDAYNDLYAPGSDYAAAAGNPIKYEDADEYADKITALKVEAAEKLIKALPVGATVAQIAKAQAAVDALGFEGICKISDTWLTKLDKFTQDANYIAAAEVKALKIKASSTAKKGSITVKWKVTGDTSAVQYYEIRKSTKLKKGFGNKPYFKTTKKTYKNTKGLKKGTRYYYKVRAVAVVDGVKYTSDWSNKAYRIAK